MRKSFILQYLLPIMMAGLFTCLIFYLTLFTEINPGSPVFLAVIFFLVLTLFSLFLVFRRAAGDETFRKAASERLEEADEKYRSLLETSTEGTLLILDGKIEYVNFVFMAMSGYTLKELKGMNYGDLILGKENASLLPENIHDEPGESGHTFSEEGRISCKRGNMRPVVFSISRIRLMEKEGLMIIVKDMSGREKMEQESIQLRNELHSSILMMNLPISSFAREFFSCRMDNSILEAAQKMQRKKQNALIVTTDQEQPIGMLTDHDLGIRVVAEGRDFKDPVTEIMSSPLVRIQDQALLYEGILKIQENSVSHLVVEDRNGRITGIFSKQDLIDVQQNTISFLIREVNAANTVESLKNIHSKIPVLVKILMESGAKIRNITYMISTVTDAITQRLVELAFEELGNPPARFAFLALGSEGRREQTLVTDQDNAIVIEDVPNEKLSEVSRYFLYFGKKINLWLDRIGYQYCKGKVMAGNPQWCQPLSRWKAYFSDWVANKSPDGVLGVAVFFDFRIVYGDDELALELRKHIQKSVSGNEAFLSYLAREVSEYKIPVNIFRQNGQETDPAVPESFNVKNALSPLIGFIRVYALQNKIFENDTLQRLEKLLRLNILEESDCQELDTIYCRLMEIRFRSQVNAILANRAPDNMVGQDELTVMEQTMIQKAFSEIVRFQDLIVDDFN
jgi:PAS domain S-box-containing protein